MALNFKNGLGATHMSVAAAAAFLQLDNSTVYQLIEDGQLEAFRLTARNTRISKASLERYLAEQQAAPVHDHRLQEKLRQQRRRQIAQKQTPLKRKPPKQPPNGG